MMAKKKTIKLDPLEAAAFVVALTALMLFIAGFLVPPLGVIDPSVLKGIGELLGFVAVFFAWYAVKQGRSAVFSYGNTKATIKGNSTNTNTEKEKENEE